MKNILIVIFLFVVFFASAQDSVVVNKMCFNTSFDEFGIRIIDGKFFVVSASRDNLDGIPIVDESIDKPFFDLYEVNQCELKLSEIDSDKKGIKLLMSSEFHDGPIAIGDKGRILFFTCNQNFDNYSGKLGIFYSIKSDKGWSRPLAFPVNSSEYNVSHPFYSDLEGKLYFVSDMPGGKGGMDIYSMSHKFEDWFGLTNIQFANSTSNETFPILHESSLYFTSDKNKINKGLDIFYIEKDSITPKEISFNSDKDDLSIYFDNNNHGYFSSRRGSNGLNDDVYEFNIIKKVIENNSNPLIAIEEDSIIDNGINEFIGQLELLKKRLVEFENKLASSEAAMLSYDFINLMRKASKNIGLEIESCYSLDKSRLVAEIQRISNEITALDDLLNEELRKISATAKNQENVKVVDNSESVNLLIDKTKIENILFETAKWEIPEAHRKELSAIVALLKTNAMLTITVSGHTDNVGGAEYNMTLSKNRAESVKRFLVNQGIESKRIKVKYFGLTMPIESNDTESGRLKNRRVEMNVESRIDLYSQIVNESIDENTVHYKIQFLSSTKPIQAGSNEFKGLSNIIEVQANSAYKYYVGLTKNIDVAKNNQKILREIGFEGAFIAAFRGSQRISMEEANRK
jgi:outer membrane protein OmpA-like peptidoglycan-associated protein